MSDRNHAPSPGLKMRMPTFTSKRSVPRQTVRRSLPTWIISLAASMLLAFALAGPASAASAAVPAPPANDEVANAQSIGNLPATLSGTTVGASTTAEEPTCEGATKNSVWYSLHASANTAQRIAVELAAAGNLEAVLSVYRVVRSQLQQVGCEATDEEGKVSLTFKTQKEAVYDIRVAARSSSQLAGFTLNVFLPTPAVAPPGPPLPTRGANGHVDRIQDVNAAYSLTLHSGVSYMIDLNTKTRGGACVTGSLYPPDTRSFEDGSSVLSIQCGGYRLFTPGPGQGGRYSLELTPNGSHVGAQRFHVQVARAGADETAPGIALRNYGVAHAALNGAGVQVLRLYRLDVTSHSKLTLRLHAPRRAEFSLMLVGVNGNQIECACGGGGAQTLQHKLTAGRYYAAVLARNGTAGSFSLERESRTITRTEVYFADARARHGRATVGAGHATPIHIHVLHGDSGLVTVELERFDPLFGWQFYRQLRAPLHGGVASIPFTAPAVGQWRVDAVYAGSRVSSPSRVGFSYLLVN
ncbi:MAG TPA: hypothetical protein VGL37_03640 [Solirubrobacteraceae bacterium]